MEQQQSLTRLLALGTLETVLNQAIALESQSAARLTALHGTVVRIRLEKPATSIYMLLAEDGIEILHDYEGSVDIRIRANLGALLHWLIAPGAIAADDEHIRITGNEPQLGQLLAAMAEFDLWGALRSWVDNHLRLEDLVVLLRREDPRWFNRLEQVSDRVELIADELGRQRLLQEEVLDALHGLTKGMRRERRLDLLFLCSGMSLLFGAFATASGQLPVLLLETEAGLQTLIMASIGLTLILSRILFGHRYS
ncbi:MAG: SCP2 sterol-binding domain-containing protein [Alcanivoracaceae bacterium]|nr:SCP2 sterol-binding domain-containing protein [Alcanivoracaceae bacterium]